MSTPCLGHVPVPNHLISRHRSLYPPAFCVEVHRCRSAVLLNSPWSQIRPEYMRFWDTNNCNALTSPHVVGVQPWMKVGSTNLPSGPTLCSRQPWSSNDIHRLEEEYWGRSEDQVPYRTTVDVGPPRRIPSPAATMSHSTLSTYTKDPTWYFKSPQNFSSLAQPRIPWSWSFINYVAQRHVKSRYIYSCRPHSTTRDALGHHCIKHVDRK